MTETDYVMKKGNQLDQLRTNIENLKNDIMPTNMNIIYEKFPEDKFDINNVIAALESSSYDWRTIDGIANDTKLSPDRIAHIVNILDKYIVSAYIPDKKGYPVYTTRAHYYNTHNIFNRLLSIAGRHTRL